MRGNIRRRACGGVFRGFGMAALLGAGAVALAGCAASAGGGGGPKSAAGRDAASSYRAGQYASAYEEAASAHPGAGGRARAELALIAGLSAQALKRDADAERWLTPLIDHPDAEISGRAGAAVGLIAQSRGEHDRAIQLLSAAARGLSGDDAAHANLHAGDSASALGRSQSARMYYDLALGSAQDDALKRQITGRLGGSSAGGAFTVQVGAFATRANAEKVAANVRPKATQLGMGEPRIVEKSARGRTLFAVHVGAFESKEAAQAAGRRLGGQTVITASAG